MRWTVPSRILPRLPLVLAALAASLWLSGCVVAPLPPAGPPVVVGPGGPGPGGPGPGPVAGPVIVAPAAPPQMPAEAVVVAPGPGYVWIAGYWNWAGGRYAWAPGRWAVPPRPGLRWIPRHWAQGPNGWHGHGGYWAR